jgi:putative Mg2+ transporter-C (MgtC) family protein
MTNEEIFLRLLIPLVLGMVIGLERIYNGHDAGVRTHAITAMGASLFIITSILASIQLNVSQIETIRIIGQIVAGIGFLGAGLIFFSAKENHKKGLTSAATLWATSAIGATCGFGYYGIAITAALLIMFTLTVVAKLEWRLLKMTGKAKRKKSAKTPVILDENQ